jgi:hypothetical protein
MSAVFMCDSCGELFSANEVGWRQFQEEWDGNPVTRKEYNNAYNHGKLVRHVGPCCALKGNTPKPRLAIGGSEDDR